MKVKNIAFSGFAAAILATGAANAAVTEIASKGYVDGKVTDTLQKVSNTYISKDDLGSSVGDILKDEESDLAKELAGKQDALNEAQMNAVNSGITGAVLSGIQSDITNLGNNKADKLTGMTEATAGSIAMVDINGQYQLTDVKVGDLVTDGSVTDKITEALSDNGIKEIITNIVSDGDVVKEAIDASVKSTDEGSLGAALATKADKDSVYTTGETDAKIIELAIPQPEGDCAAQSKRCVLSVDADSKTLTWVDVTSPLEAEE